MRTRVVGGQREITESTCEDLRPSNITELAERVDASESDGAYSDTVVSELYWFRRRSSHFRTFHWWTSEGVTNPRQKHDEAGVRLCH